MSLSVSGSDLALWIAAQWHTRTAIPVISLFRLRLSYSVLKTENCLIAIPDPTSKLKSWTSLGRMPESGLVPIITAGKTH